MAKNEIDFINTAKHTNILSLFTSGSTLICCALPATLVAIGSAATLTSLISTFPQLIWLSEHKGLVFGIAGIMLVLAGILQWQSRYSACPADPALAQICSAARRQSLWIYIISVLIFSIGVFFAFIAPLLL